MRARATGRFPVLYQSLGAAADDLKSSAERLDTRTDMAGALRQEIAAMRTSPPESPPPPDSEPRAFEWHVLIVEDETLQARTLARMLHREGYRVTIAHDGEHACRVLGANPDVVVVDLGLGPGCSGRSVAREARRRCPEAVVYIWTGAVLDAAELLKETGAHDVFHKAAPWERLVTAIYSARVKAQRATMPGT